MPVIRTTHSVSTVHPGGGFASTTCAISQDDAPEDPPDDPPDAAPDDPLAELVVPEEPLELEVDDSLPHARAVHAPAATKAPRNTKRMDSS